MAWKKTITLKALEKAGNTSVQVGDKVVFIAHSDGKLYAMDGVCSHARCILGTLVQENKTVKCWCHDAVFELENGKMIEPPYVAKNAPMEKLGLKTYEIRESGGFVEVDLPD
ncbi:sulredoxin [uncultured archaeon]|nr:sulredoxin [uncultured archaeon]HKJ96839.1 sulredoxin [Thermoplasmataceae archaeon]